MPRLRNGGPSTSPLTATCDLAGGPRPLASDLHGREDPAVRAAGSAGAAACPCVWGTVMSSQKTSTLRELAEKKVSISFRSARLGQMAAPGPPVPPQKHSPPAETSCLGTGLKPGPVLGFRGAWRLCRLGGDLRTRPLLTLIRSKFYLLQRRFHKTRFTLSPCPLPFRRL